MDNKAMDLHKFRVLLDTEEDVFRDLELDTETSLEELHQTIIKAFGLKGQEMASFFESNAKWEKGREFPLMDMGVEEGQMKTMRDIMVQDLVKKDDSLKLLYVYDFLNMWIFYVDMVKSIESKEGEEYPRIALKFGEPPEEKDTDPLEGLDLGEDGQAQKGNNKDNGEDEDLGNEVDDMFKDL